VIDGTAHRLAWRTGAPYCTAGVPRGPPMVSARGRRAHRGAQGS